MATVLVAEDDSEMRSLVAKVLGDEGHHVVEVPDGGRLLVALSHGLRSPTARLPDIVVSDVNMPVMTGLAMAAALHSTSRRLPVVLMTAFPSEETVRRAQQYGAMLIEKPFALQRLVDAVAEALR